MLLTSGLTLIVISILAVIAVIAVRIIATSGSASKPNSLIVRRPLLTDAEVRVLDMIERALPSRRISVQVAMGALLRAKGGSASGRASARGRFSQKICDFVILDAQSSQVLAVVELDDASHDPGRDAKRDAMLAAGGYRVVRLPSRPTPTHRSVAAALRDFVNDDLVTAPNLGP